MAAMRRGDFAAAWHISDRVLEQRRQSGLSCWRWPRHLQYVWTGEPLDGKRVLVRCYHGLGDTLQFVRFAAPLRARASEVIFWAQPTLLPLLNTVRGIDHCLPLHDGAPDIDFDVDIELLELPHALRISAEELVAGDGAYVHPPPSAAAPRRDANLRVGIAWQSGEWNPQRSIPLSALRPLKDLPGVRLFSLQYGRGALAAEVLGAEDLSCREIECMAARMQSLDLVISVDTMVGHLAGALALPVWLLLCSECDWRWMQGRSDSPWYPSMRLFRQCSAADWSGVMHELLAALREQRRT
jgi:hypothetical protein